MANITDKEAEALKKFQERLGPFLDQLSDEQKKDYNLVKWLRARDLNIQKAEEMLRKHMEYRKKNDIDNILSWRTDVIDFKNTLPVYIPGKDKEGSYFLIMPSGKWDIRAICEAGKKETLRKGSHQFFEMVSKLAEKATEEKGEPLPQVTYLQDMEDYSIRQMLSSDTRESNLENMKILEANYPESMKKAIIVNAPKVFSLLFNMLKPILSAHTLSKVEIYDSNRDKWRHALTALVDPDNLPSYYGGSNTSCKPFDLDIGGLELHPLPPSYSDKDHQYQQLVVPAGKTYEIEVDVEESGTQLSWNFKTDDYDIGFNFLHDGATIFENKRCDSHLLVQKGYYDCTSSGTYTLQFVNTYSKMRSKTVHYYIHKDTKKSSD